MQLLIKRKVKPTVPFIVILDRREITINVAGHSRFLVDNSRLCWTWVDGKQYSLQCPIFSPFKSPSWQLALEGQTIYFAHMVQPSLRDILYGAMFPKCEWTSDEKKYVVEPVCLGGTIQDQSGNKLAVWKDRRVVEVVCRAVIQNAVVPAIVGMILAILYDPTPD